VNEAFASLSREQREVVFEKNGLFAVRACPGSGKTYCVAARLARLLGTWPFERRGIAALSFTNVAWQTVEAELGRTFGITTPIGHPHYLRTIDSFINQYLILPYGHLYLKCGRRPTLVGEPHGSWAGANFYQSGFDKISFDVDGSLSFTRRDWARADVLEGQADKFFRAKQGLLAAGYVTQADANYIAVWLLENHPVLAGSLVNRFPCMILDEAQDTSGSQMRMLDLLIEAGLSEVMLVGDPDQAIYEWRDARPDLFSSKVEAWYVRSAVLEENRRSSTAICDATYGISTLDEASKAVDPVVAEFGLPPQIIVYSGDVAELVRRYLSICKDSGVSISPDSVAVLFRSASMAMEIAAGSAVSPWLEGDLVTGKLALARFLCQEAEWKLGLELLERTILRITLGDTAVDRVAVTGYVESIGVKDFRRAVYGLAVRLPRADGAAGPWAAKAEQVLREAGYDATLGVKRRSETAMLEDVFAGEQVALRNEFNCTIGTVHSAKGETFEAVLLILKSKGRGPLYRTLLRRGATTSDHEELRIAYVGLTRPKKVLCLGLPSEDDASAWRERMGRIEPDPDP
jgi:DNA helicase II / ATP-dependent DNA helicase PcrA